MTAATKAGLMVGSKAVATAGQKEAPKAALKAASKVDTTVAM